MTRFPTLAGPLQASATVLLTVPSIALFGLLLPFYSKSGQGLGKRRRNRASSRIPKQAISPQTMSSSARGSNGIFSM
jgi:ABC-type proline/glycine betaine transport system permease subunit